MRARHTGRTSRMSSEPAPIFEAVLTPARSLPDAAATAVVAVLLAGSTVVAIIMIALGGWPVLGFAGAEVGLTLGLFTLHRRRAARIREVLRLTAEGLRIERTDARGATRATTLDPYWARLSLEDRPGRVSLLVLRARDRAFEVGELLGEDAKRELFLAFDGALRRWRDPRFDNPQLRD